MVLTGDDTGAAAFSQWCRLCAGAAPLCQPTAAFGKNFLFYVACLAAPFALGKLDTSPLPSCLSACSGIWFVSVEYSELDCSGDPACTSLGSTVDTCSSRGIGRIFLRCGELDSLGVSPSFTQNGERAQSMLLVEVALSAVLTLTLDVISGALQMAVCGNFRCVVQHFSGTPMMKTPSPLGAHANSFPSDVAIDTVVEARVNNNNRPCVTFVFLRCVQSETSCG